MKWHSTRYTLDQLREAVSDSLSYNEVARKLGLAENSNGNNKTLQRLVIQYELDITHFQHFGHSKGISRRPLSDYLCENGPKINSYRLKLRLIKEGVFEEKCTRCGIREWMGKKAPLQLDHVNGNAQDNRLVNLRLLCANCHAQTPTFCGKNATRPKKTYIYYTCETCKASFAARRAGRKYCSRKCYHDSLRINPRPYVRKVKGRPAIDQLKREVAKTSYAAVGRKYGVSDNAIRKWIRQ